MGPVSQRRGVPSRASSLRAASGLSCQEAELPVRASRVSAGGLQPRHAQQSAPYSPPGSLAQPAWGPRPCPEAGGKAGGRWGVVFPHAGKRSQQVCIWKPTSVFPAQLGQGNIFEKSGLYTSAGTLPQVLAVLAQEDGGRLPRPLVLHLSACALLPVPPSQHAPGSHWPHMAGVWLTLLQTDRRGVVGRAGVLCPGITANRADSPGECPLPV